jgi:hypothetical protein
MPDNVRDELLFMQLVAMFQYAAMQQMGKLPSPVSGRIGRDLEQAKASIAMVEMLRNRTEGNRSAGETEFLDKVLFELRMNFVDESRRPADAPPEGTDSQKETEGGAS